MNVSVFGRFPTLCVKGKSTGEQNFSREQRQKKMTRVVLVLKVQCAASKATRLQIATSGKMADTKT